MEERNPMPSDEVFDEIIRRKDSNALFEVFIGGLPETQRQELRRQAEVYRQGMLEWAHMLEDHRRNNG